MPTSSQLIERPQRQPDDGLGAPRPRSRRPSSPFRAASDRRLARRAGNGDRQAIAVIFERYRQELYGFCLGLLGEPQDAQDALQNTMVKVLGALPGEEREIALRPWLYRIARNESIELRRSRRPTQALEGHLLDGQSSVTERAEQREQLEWLLKDLDDLPERQRAVLVMRELSGLDFAEIGAALDTSGAVVRQSLYEARRNLEQMDRGRALKCEGVTRVLSDADGRITRRRDIRAHLRDCPDCERFRDAIRKRESVLAAIPPISLPGGAAAGIAQALFGGSGGGGTLAAATGSAAKSAGAYGVLKAAGTLAAVAVIGTAAMQGEMKSSPPGSSAREALPQARDKALRLSSGRQAETASPSNRFVSIAGKLSSTSVSGQISDRRPRPSSAKAHEFAVEAGARPTDLPQTTPHAAQPPAAVSEEPVPGEETSFSPGNAKSQDRAQKPEKQPGSPAKPEKKDKPDHPVNPSHPNKAKTTSGTGSPSQSGSPPQSESDPGQAKTPPGQAKKQASAETQEPPPMPSPVETETVSATVEAEATLPIPGHDPNGNAKGHEK